MSVVDTHTLTSNRADFDTDVADTRDDDDVDYSGWFCIETAPWPCPADGCDFVANHMTAAHLVVVFPNDDDSKLLAQARNAREAGRDPRIAEYRPDMGPCIPIDVWLRMGRPVHGQVPTPAGWADRTGSRL